jgi:ZipA-like protein with FtsZ-binding domain
MTDLQIGLLVIGAAAVAGVLVYNRLQERATRREAEKAFGSQHADVLLKDPVERREPTLQDRSDKTPPTPSRPQAVAADPRIDYVLELQGTSAGAFRPDWVALQRRFGRRAVLTEAAGRRLHAALQMVSRDGVVSESELLAFRSQVETMAATHRASVSAPPVREALEAAQGLDRTCADVDVQIALHVLGGAETTLENEGFSVTPRAGGVTLLLDLPRTPDLAKSYAAMVKAARQLGGRVVDDNGNSLDDSALAAIGVEVQALGARLSQIGIQPGSPLAQRLFS